MGISKELFTVLFLIDSLDKEATISNLAKSVYHVKEDFNYKISFDFVEEKGSFRSLDFEEFMNILLLNDIIEMKQNLFKKEYYFLTSFGERLLKELQEKGTKESLATPKKFISRYYKSITNEVKILPDRLITIF